jgi:renalase
MISDLPDVRPKPKKCLIIGAGISGLMAATVLQRHGMNVTVLDKGQGVGGRLATRRLKHPRDGEGIFDYGAQFFTVSDPLFQAWVEGWRQSGVVKEWSSQLSGAGKPCYQGVKSNRSIAQHLAKGLDVHTQTRVIKMIWDAPDWRVQTEDGACYQGDVLMVTSPIPQFLELFDSSEIVLPWELRHRLEQVIYQCCIALLVLLEKPSLIPAPGGLWLADSALAWIACNQQKGISLGSAVTLHATPEFSQTHWETDAAITAQKLLDIASPWLGSTVVDYQVHRWRYSQPQTFFGASYLALREPGLCVMAGDAFSPTAPTVPSLNLERAVLSGIAAANYLLGFSEAEVNVGAPG